MKQIGVGTFSVTPLMRTYVNDVLNTSRISYGPYSRRFEDEFSTIHGAKYGVLSNSGTSSLHVALQTLIELHEIPDGAKVIIPGLTFVATANIVLHCGLTPVTVDVDPETYNMSPYWLEKELGLHDDVHVVIPVHLFGQPADMAAITNRVEEYELEQGRKCYIIEDSCEAMLAETGGEVVGSWGDIACFSMYVAHFITTGVGGMAITSNPEYADIMRSLVNHGRDGIYTNIDDDDTAEKAQQVMKRRFSFERVGHSFRITELESALGLAQIPDLPSMITRRQHNAVVLTKYLAVVAQDNLILPVTAPGNTHSWMMYPIIVRGEDKWGVCSHLESKGIETREMLPLTNQPVYRDYPHINKPLKITDVVNRGGFYVGIHQDLDQSDMRYIADAIIEYFAGQS